MEAVMGNYRALLNTYNPQEILFTDPQAWEDIYNRSEKKPEFTRNPQSWLPDLSKTPSIFNVDGEHYESFRMLISKVLSAPTVQTYEPLVQKYTDLLVSEITQKAQPLSRTGVVNITSWLSFTTYDIMHHLCLGEPSHCLESSRHQAWLDLRFRDPGWALSDMANHLVPAHTPSWNSRVYSMLNRQVQTTFQGLRASFEKPRNEATTDTSDTLITHGSLSDPKLRTQIEETILIMHIKGSEATATVLSGILHHLVKQQRKAGTGEPTSLEIVTKEIRSNFVSNSEMSNESLRRLPYLNAVMKEGLRLCPPFPSSFTRYVPAGGATVCGQYLAANVRCQEYSGESQLTRCQTPVSIDRLVMCRAASNFSEPEIFRPERWLEAADKSCPHAGSHVHNESAFRPFGHGSGMCLGNDLAHMMILVVLAKLLWHFDLLQAEPMLSWESQKSEVMVERRPWNLCLGLRRQEEGNNDELNKDGNGGSAVQ